MVNYSKLYKELHMLNSEGSIKSYRIIIKKKMNN